MKEEIPPLNLSHINDMFQLEQMHRNAKYRRGIALDLGHTEIAQSINNEIQAIKARKKELRQSS